MKKIEILLATFNGENYLEALLESISSQTYSDWVLSVADDGSSDGTLEILKKFQNKFKDRVFIKVNSTRMGASENFMNLMASMKLDLVAFCDQDDIWLPNKLSRLYDEYMEQERKSKDTKSPILIYSDARIVDEKLKTLQPSLFQFHKTQGSVSHSYNMLKYRNCITGCTVLTNRDAVNMAIKSATDLFHKFQTKVVMHDHWLGLVVSVNSGSIVRVEDALVLYRQHEKNAVGAVKARASFKLLIRKAKNIWKKYLMVKSLEEGSFFIIYFLKHLQYSMRNR
jgi:glycosyltransferase involved in cell wall biosynthesis